MVHLVEGKNYGFAEVEDERGNRLRMYMHIAMGLEGVQRGDRVIFEVGENDLGPTAVNASLAKPQQAECAPAAA